MNFEGTQQYHQAGLILYGNDDNFTKFGRIAHTAAGDEKFEFIYENNDTPRNEAADSTPNIAADFPDDFYVRITSDGTNIVGAYSTDGSAWTPVGRPAPMPANARIGMFAFSNAAAASPVAAFDWFELDGPGGGGGGGGSEFSDAFDGAALDTDRWDAIVRDNPAAYTVGGGAADDHHRAGRHLHRRHQPAAEQLHPPGRGPRGRRLGDRDEAVRHDQRRLRPGRPDRLLER